MPGGRILTFCRRRIRLIYRRRRAKRWPGRPVSREWGLDRGRPVDRRYIESFLSEHARDVRGRVLEVGVDRYTRTFGGSAVTRSDVLHVTGAPGATIVADLADGVGVPRNAFDAIVLTQTLHLIYDVEAAVRVLYEALAADGVLLVTAPGISHVSREDADRWGDHWRFTAQSLERLLRERFGGENVVVRTYGNVKVATAYLYGLAQEELAAGDFAVDDPDYPVIVAARAVRR